MGHCHSDVTILEDVSTVFHRNAIQTYKACPPYPFPKTCEDDVVLWVMVPTYWLDKSGSQNDIGRVTNHRCMPMLCAILIASTAHDRMFFPPSSFLSHHHVSNRSDWTHTSRFGSYPVSSNAFLDISLVDYLANVFKGHRWSSYLGRLVELLRAALVCPLAIQQRWVPASS